MKKLFLSLLLSLSVILPAKSTDWGISNELNICSLERCMFPPQLYPKFQSIGMRSIRYWVYWNTVNPAKDVYDWSQPDREIGNAVAAGIEVYVNVSWAPEWVADGKPTYLPYTAGCSAWNDPKDGSKGIHFALEKDYCANPPHIDADAAREFGRQIALRYKGRVHYYGFGNEPNYSLYWPPRLPENSQYADYARLFNEVTVPFSEGIKQADPSARFVGPECDEADCLNKMLTLEQQHGSRVYDVVSFHGYSWGAKYPEIALQRVENEFMPVVHSLLNGRPFWITETGPVTPESNQEQWFAELKPFLVRARELGASRVIVFNSGAFFDFATLEPRPVSVLFRQFWASSQRRRSVRYNVEPKPIIQFPIKDK